MMKYFQTSIMRRVLKLFLGFLIPWLVITCSEDDSPTGPPGEDFQYPLTPGDRWQYSRTFTQFNVRGDSADVAQFDTTISSSALWEVVGRDTLPGGVGTVVLKETITTSNDISFMSENYYRNEKNGLFLHAHKGAASVLLKSTPGRLLLFSGRYFHTTREIVSFVENAIFRNSAQDSLIIESPPLKSLQYPLQIGSNWTVSEKFFKVEKTVVGQEKVTVPAGEFECLKIQLQNEFDDQIEFFDFISTEGLVLRTVVVRDIVVTTPDNPDGTGIIFDVRDEARLTDFELN